MTLACFLKKMQKPQVLQKQVQGTDKKELKINYASLINFSYLT